MRPKSSLVVVAAVELFVASAVVEAGSAELNPTEIVSARFSNELPTQVAKNALNAVALSVARPNAKPSTYGASPVWFGQEAYFFSGVRIGTNEYLGPGHGVMDEKTGHPIVNITDCKMIYVDEETTPFSATEYTANKFYSPYEATSRAPDAAIFDSGSEQTNDEAPFMGQSIDHSPVDIGEKLYFVNYEPTPGKNQQQRTPFVTTARTPQDATLLSQPAELGGVVVGHESNGDIDTLVGMKSYGAIKDAYIRGGASGGAVFAVNGSLVGISDAADFNTKTNEANTMSLEQAEDKYHIELTGLPPDTKVETVIVQPVNHVLIKKLRSGLAKSAGCVKPKQ